MFISLLIAFTSGYKENPKEYEAEGVSHIDYEKDQMPIKMNREGSTNVQRMDRFSESPQKYERASVRHSEMENYQTPAEDRNWHVKPKTKRMSSSKAGRKVHIYLKNEDLKKPIKKPTTLTVKSTTESSVRPSESTESHTEAQTKKTPELTTKSDKDVRSLKYADKDTIAESSNRSKQTVDPKDSQTEASEFDHIVKEKIKIKHHHHHHHHNHVRFLSEAKL